MRKQLSGLLAGLLCLLITVNLQPVSAQSQIMIPDDPATWDGQSRFNILVMGMDRRPGARDTLRVRTDVMLLVSFDPANNRLGILHIPRDTHLALLDGDLIRVNTMLVEGEDMQEGYGPYYAMQTIQNNFGMYVDAYVAFDFVAFMEFIDAIGGITVDVPYVINDQAFPNMNYGYDPLYLSPGEYTFDGYDALRYARTRHGDNDFVRGERQLQVIQAVREKLSSPRVLQELIVNAPDLMQELNGHFYTNLPQQQILYLGMSMMLLDGDDISTGVLNPDYTYVYRYSGERVRVPDFEALPGLLAELFGETYWQ
jgi:LCP family protein required for cell wall assembly